VTAPVQGRVELQGARIWVSSPRRKSGALRRLAAEQPGNECEPAACAAHVAADFSRRVGPGRHRGPGPADIGSTHPAQGDGQGAEVGPPATRQAVEDWVKAPGGSAAPGP